MPLENPPIGDPGMMPLRLARPTHSPPIPDVIILLGDKTKTVWRWLDTVLGMGRRALAHWAPGSDAQTPPRELLEAPVPVATEYRPLKRVLVTDAVARQMFLEYAEHRRSDRGANETGWVLLGRRDADEATILASLPAGAACDSGEAHVRFNSTAQVVASRIVRQSDRRLALVGVVHTHPGSLRHPTDGDFRGDIQWVGQLRGRQGVFGIGTADGAFADDAAVMRQPRPNMHAFADMTFAWYSLREEDTTYHALPVELVPGPDVAEPLRRVWPVIEEHGLRLERLMRQLTGVQFAVDGSGELALMVPMVESPVTVRVLLSQKSVKYYLVRDGVLAADLRDPLVDRGVYRLMAELANE